MSYSCINAHNWYGCDGISTSRVLKPWYRYRCIPSNYSICAVMLMLPLQMFSLGKWATSLNDGLYWWKSKTANLLLVVTMSEPASWHVPSIIFLFNVASLNMSPFICLPGHFYHILFYYFFQLWSTPLTLSVVCVCSLNLEIVTTL